MLGWFGYLNYLLFLANLLPALPFDGGRMFRAYLSSTSVVSARDNDLRPLDRAGDRGDPVPDRPGPPASSR